MANSGQKDVFKKKLMAWGGSIGIRIPNVLIKNSKFHEGVEVSMRLINDTTLMIKIENEKPTKKYKIHFMKQ